MNKQLRYLQALVSNDIIIEVANHHDWEDFISFIIEFDEDISIHSASIILINVLEKYKPFVDNNDRITITNCGEKFYFENNNLHKI